MTEAKIVVIDVDMSSRRIVGLLRTRGDEFVISNSWEPVLEEQLKQRKHFVQLSNISGPRRKSDRKRNRANRWR